MKKKIIILAGLFVILLVAIGVFAANRNTVSTVNFNDKVYVPQNKTINFNNKVYKLNKVYANSDGGYTNNYYADDENFDTYHTAVVVDEFPNTDYETLKKKFYTNISKFIESGDKKNTLLIKVEPIDQNSFLIRQCTLGAVNNPTIKCDYTNVQKGVDANSSVIFCYVRRYFKEDGILTDRNFPQVIEKDYAKIKPYITTVKPPKVVRPTSVKDIINDL